MHGPLNHSQEGLTVTGRGGMRRAATPSLSLPSAQQPPSPISAPHHTVGLAQGAKRLDVTDQLAATCTREWRALPRGPQLAVPTKPLPAGNRRAPPNCLTSLETTKAPPLSMRGSPADRLPSLLTLYRSALRGRRQRTRPSPSVHRRGCLKLRTLLTITPRSSYHVLNRRKWVLFAGHPIPSCRNQS